MHSKPQFQNSLSRTISRAATLALVIVFVLALILIFTQPAEAQTFKVLYTFTGQADGGIPSVGVTMDSAGNLYGTTSMGGYTGGSCGLNQQFPGCGTVYKLSQQGSGWTFAPLYAFHGAPDGAYPWARVIIGPDGSLFGTTVGGGKALAGWTSGQSSGYGTVFNLKPPSESSSPWSETVLYRFQGGDDGAGPTTGDLTFDPEGTIYGTTDGISGRYHGATTVYQLSPSDGVWTKNTLHRFTGGVDGSCTGGGVVFDEAGNLYGVTCFGGDSLGGVCGSLGCGTVFQLTHSGSGWTKNILYSFQGGSDGAYPSGGLIIDAAGTFTAPPSCTVQATAAQCSCCHLPMEHGHSICSTALLEMEIQPPASSWTQRTTSTVRQPRGALMGTVRCSN